MHHKVLTSNQMGQHVPCSTVFKTFDRIEESDWIVHKYKEIERHSLGFPMKVLPSGRYESVPCSSASGSPICSLIDSFSGSDKVDELEELDSPDNGAVTDNSNYVQCQKQAS